VLIVLLQIFFIITVHGIQLETIEVRAKKEISQFSFSQGYRLSPSESPLSPLSFLLNDVPGTILNQSGGPGSQLSLSIRGTETGHVLWTLDGLKLNDSSNTDRSFDASFLSSGFMDRIEVHKGPQAVLFGSDALGGVVELTTRKGSNIPQTQLKFSGGSFGTFDTGISQDWQTQNAQGTLHTGIFQTDGISRLNKKRYNAKEADSTKMIHFMSSSRHRWNPKSESDFLLGFIQGKNELDTSSNDSNDDKSKNDQYLIQHKLTREIINNSVISLRNGLNRHQRRIDSSLGLLLYEGNNLQHELLLRKKISTIELLAGASSEHQDFLSNKVKKNADLTSLFLQTGWFISTLKIHAGLRSDYHSRYHLFQTGSFGLGWDHKFGHNSLQYSQGYKAPSLYQLYGPSFDGTPIGNPHLTPELNKSIEARWRFKRHFFEIDLGLFRNQLQNLITYFPSTGYKNQNSFVSEGLDGEFSLLSERGSIRLGGLHQRFINSKQTVLRRPLNSVKARLNYFLNDRSEFEVKSRWFGARKDLKPNQQKISLSSYEVIDLGYYYRLRQKTFGLKLLNLMNRDYEDIYGFSVMPRSLFAEVLFNF
jgi:vitamin B12 transporter